MKKEITIDGNRIYDKKSFYEEINRVFMYNEEWKLVESLDALDDLFYGGFGCVKVNEEVRLIWKNFKENQQLFGYDFTLNFYREKLQNPQMFDSKLIEKRLKELEEGKGMTYFDMILAIISEHPTIELVKK